MSFLNPVNEPVMRFSSKDVGAPQINYATRTAGDVKAVLKACLVTGYGATASAGWSIVNEVNHVAELVSPSVAMSDYRLGIDDTSAASTTWYYQYQYVRVNPALNNPQKSLNVINGTSSDNGWQMLVTERGIVFVELVQHTAVNKLSARITYWGQVKSALVGVSGNNICFFNTGHNGKIAFPFHFYDRADVHLSLDAHSSTYISAATSNILAASRYTLDSANADLVSPIYLASGVRTQILGELPPMLSKAVNKTADLYGINEQILDTRSVLSVCAGTAYANALDANEFGRTFLIRTDYWEY